MRLLNSFYIRTKTRQRVRYKRKPVQEHFAKNKTGRDYILKARQEGITTEMQLNQLEKTLTKKYTVQATIAHKRKSAEKIFRIAKFAWDNLPEKTRSIYKINTENTRELQFESMSSSYFVDIEARGETIHNLHVSEFAFVKDIESLIASTFEAVPSDGSIVLETTANGMNQAYEFWNDAVAGRNEFKAHFYNWTWEPDYATEPPETKEWKEDYLQLAKKYNLILDIESRFNLHESQFYWYYLKARRLKELIKQEYPTTSEEAFLSQSNMVFDILQVSQLDSLPILEKYFEVEIYDKIYKDHDYIIGIDTAEGVGNDGTAIEIIDVTDSSKIVEVGSFFDRNIRPDQTAVLAVKLAKIFNNAFIIPERNNSGLTTVLKLEELNYTNTFRNITIDKTNKKKKKELGWRTTGVNRDVMIDDFIESFEDELIEIRSSNMIKQMKTFVRKENGKREHDQGKNDDNLFAMFLAFQGKKYHRSQRARVHRVRPKAFR